MKTNLKMNRLWRTAGLCAFALAATHPLATAAYSLNLSDSRVHNYDGGSDNTENPMHYISDSYALTGNINPAVSTGPGSSFEIEIKPTVDTTYSYSLPAGITGRFDIWLNSPDYAYEYVYYIASPTVSFTGATGTVPTVFEAIVCQSGIT